MFLIGIVMICFMTGLFLTWFFVHKAGVNERLILIEKGVDLSNLPQRGKFKINFPWLKLGIVITCASLGLAIGIYIESFSEILKYYEGLFPLVSLFLFGGIGMIVAHYLDKPKEQK